MRTWPVASSARRTMKSQYGSVKPLDRTPYERRNGRQRRLTRGWDQCLPARPGRRRYCEMWAVFTACSNIVISALWMAAGVVAV